jgi:hypothetical protein
MKATRCALLAALAIAACVQREGAPPDVNRSGAVGTAHLFTEFRKNGEELIPLIHVLFVPDADIDPREPYGYGAAAASGGTFDEFRFRTTFAGLTWSGAKLSVQSHPAYLRKLQTFEADGRSFALSRGKIFLVNVARDGSLRAVQVPPGPHDPGSDPASVVEYMKRRLPSEARLQALDTTKH